jgi:hypothetical protein
MAGNRAVASLVPRMLARKPYFDPITQLWHDTEERAPDTGELVPPTSFPFVDPKRGQKHPHPEGRKGFATENEAIEHARATGGYQPDADAPGVFQTLETAMTRDIASRIIGYLDPKGMARLHATNRADLEFVEQRTLRAGPPANETDLILGNPYHFPKAFVMDPPANTQPKKTTNTQAESAKRRKKKKPETKAEKRIVGGSKAVSGAWTVYDQVKPGRPAYVEMKLPKIGATFPSKDELFQKDDKRDMLEERGQLFSPPRIKPDKGRTWTAQINDAWVLGIIHKGLAVRFLADLRLDNLWDEKYKRPTALGREVTQLYHAGYRPVPSAVTPTADDDYAHVGVLLAPPQNPPAQPPRLVDALIDQRAMIDQFLLDAKPLWQGFPNV